MPAKKLTVAYCRVSTLEQKRRGYGIEIQTDAVQRFADGAALVIDRVYRDEAESGVLERRTELRRLLHDARRGRIQALIIPDLERLSRNVRVAENLFYRLECYGVAVFIADMPHYNGNDRKDVLVRQIREAIAEDNRKDIIERLWKGRQQRVRRGRPPGGTTPYGYNRHGHTWTVNPRELELVRLIFESAGQGQSGQAIAAILNATGVPRRNGKPWTQRQVSAILSRRLLYTAGIVRYGEATGRDERLAIAVPNRQET